MEIGKPPSSRASDYYKRIVSELVITLSASRVYHKSTFVLF